MNQLQLTKQSDFDSFLNVISNVSRVDNFPELQTLLKKAAKQLTASDATSLILRQGEKCFYLDEESAKPLWKGMSFPLSSCISGWSILNAETVAIEDIFKDERVPIALYQDKNIQSLLVVPIGKSKVIGVISVYWNDMHTPSQSEIMQLEALAGVSSLVFELMKNHSELEEIVRKRTAELEIASQRLADLAIHDELTGLYNRRGFFLMAAQAIKASDRSKKRCALIFADIDRLKSVNDEYGHHAGDEMIKTVANLLNSHFRKSDIVARMGGDEFGILVIDPDQNLDSMNNRLQSEFKLLNRSGHFPYQIDISFGSIMSELNPDTNIEQLICRADELMYLDKSRKNHRTD
jgi:diguanylate cyclase (GGDEF)-like protein